MVKETIKCTRCFNFKTMRVKDFQRFDVPSVKNQIETWGYAKVWFCSERLTYELVYINPLEVEKLTCENCPKRSV
jgi:hypothetical protein